MRILPYAAGVLAILVGLGCMPPQLINPPKACTMIYVWGLNLTVIDARTGQPIPNATATITDGSYTEVLESPYSNATGYVGAGERPGTYTLTVTAPGYQPAVPQTVTLGFDGCHVIPVSLTTTLQPI